MLNKTVTVLTPVYNRKKEIYDLFLSLQKQTSKDFEWLVVDDGSTDGTSEKIASIKNEANFSVRYIYKENGGKHTALNVGINNIESELTFIVDSDDCVNEDGIETVVNYHKKYRKYDICGYSFLRQFPDGKINGKEFSKNECIESYITTKINGNDLYSDKAEVYFTKCLKEFPFPEFEGEKFLGEDVVWIRLGRKYKMVHINKAIYTGNYLEGGLTNSRRRNNIASPNGCMCRAKEFMKNDIVFKYRLKSAIQYIVYGHFAHYTSRQLFKETDEKKLFLIALIPASIIYLSWSKKYKMIK